MSTALRTPPQNPMCLATMIFNENPPEAAAHPRPCRRARRPHLMISGLAGPGRLAAHPAPVEAAQGIDLVAGGPGMGPAALPGVPPDPASRPDAGSPLGQ